jgi:hypothetical protein
MNDKPLFIPLRTEYFEAFRNGTKTREYRTEGRMWNHLTCRPGRPVILSKGYGKAHRLNGVIGSAHLLPHPLTQQLPGWKECYGESTATAICIDIKIQ